MDMTYIRVGYGTGMVTGLEIYVNPKYLVEVFAQGKSVRFGVDTESEVFVVQFPDDEKARKFADAYVMALKVRGYVTREIWNSLAP